MRAQVADFGAQVAEVGAQPAEARAARCHESGERNSQECGKDFDFHEKYCINPL